MAAQTAQNNSAIIDILMRTGGSTTDIAALRAQVAALSANMEAVAATNRNAGVSVHDVAEKLRGQADEMRRLNELIAEYERQSSGALITNQAAASRSMLEFSRAVEDFAVSGPLGALNNMPGIFQGIGGAIGMTGTQIAKLTAGVSIAATIAFVAYENWGSFMKLLGTGKLETEAEEMDRLGKSTSRTNEETQRFLDLKERQQRVESLRKSRTDAQKAQERDVNKALVELGGENQRDVIKGLVEAHRTKLIANSTDAAAAQQEVDEHLESLKYETAYFADIPIGKTLKSAARYEADKERDPHLKDLQTKLETALDASARNMMSDAEGDPGKLTSLIKRIEEAPTAFGPKAGRLVEKLKEAHPDARADRIEAELMKDTEEHHEKLFDKASAERVAAMKKQVADTMEDDRMGAGQRQAEVNNVSGKIDAESAAGHLTPDQVAALKEVVDDARRTIRKKEQERIFAEFKKQITDAAEETRMPVDVRMEQVNTAMANIPAAMLTDAQVEGLTEAGDDARRKLRGVDLGGRFKVLKKRITDAAEDDLRPVPVLVAEVNQALADLPAQNLTEQQDIDIKEAGDDALRRLRNRDKSKSKREATAKRLLPGFDQQIQAELMENQRRLLEGQPVARTWDEYDQLDAQGFRPALRPEAQRDIMKRRIGNDLKRGNQDPTLANEILDFSQRNLNENAARNSGSQTRTMDGGNVAAGHQWNLGPKLAHTMGTLADNQMLLNKQQYDANVAAARAQQKAENAQAVLRRSANQRPSGMRMGGIR